MKMSAPARKSKWTFYFLSQAPAKSLSSMEEKKQVNSLSLYGSHHILLFYFIFFHNHTVFPFAEKKCTISSCVMGLVFCSRPGII
jgi:hypothetical protein